MRQETICARSRGARRGFTLVEVLVVLAILMGLATLVTVNVIGQQRKARIDTAKIQIRLLETALSSYHDAHRRYPTMEQGLEALASCPKIPPVPDNYPPDGYLSSRRLPKDPWGNDYVYIVPGRDGRPYEVVSYGADGRPGGAGDAADISSADF